MVFPRLTPAKLAMAAVAGVLAFSNPAHASLCGDTISVEALGMFSDGTEVSVQCGSAGPELTFPFGPLNPGEFIDIDSESISGVFEAVLFGPMETLIFSDLHWLDEMNEIIPEGAIQDVTVTGLLTPDRVEFDSNSVTVDLSNLQGTGEWTITLHTNHIPEPTSLAILGLGLAGLAYGRRRKNLVKLT